MPKQEFRFSDCLPNCSGPANDMFEQALGLLWLPGKIMATNKDRASFQALDEAEQRLMLFMLAFFLFADQMVIDNIQDNLMPEIKAELFVDGLDMDGVEAFLTQQKFMELIHGRTYKNLWEGIIPLELRERVDFEEMVGVCAKLDHMRRYCSPDVPFAERLFGWFLAEGLFFQEIFGGIFHFPEPDFPALWQSNKLISRDENLHTMFTALLYVHLREKLSPERVREIVKDFMKTCAMFCKDLLPKPIIGLSAEMLIQYTQFRCDRLLSVVGYEPMFHARNPLSYMEETGLNESTSFFEIKPSYDHGKGSLTASSGGKTSSDEELGAAGEDSIFCDEDDI